MSQFYFLFIYLLAVQNVGSQFPNQGLNPHSLHLKHRVLNHWPTREVPIFLFWFIVYGGDIIGCGFNSLVTVRDSSIFGVP